MRFFSWSIRFFARRILKKYKPRIIAVTGSVGKTSTRMAIACVLRKRGLRVRESMKNYNNELGVPLTILGSESGYRSPLRWIGIFAHAKRLWFFRDPTYPEALVIEMAADHPGDIRSLVTLAPPTVGVMTAVSGVHTEFLKTVERVAREKETLVRAIPKEGAVILNGDDALVRAMEQRTKSKTFTYGFDEKNDVRALEFQQHVHRTAEGALHVEGVSFKLSYQGSTVPVRLERMLGKQHVYAALAASAVGVLEGMHLIDIAAALQSYRGAPGRMQVLDGIKETTLIDDTYNASPRATEAALDVVGAFPHEGGQKTYVVIGEMAELGAESEAEHRRIGALAHERGADVLVTVGERARDIYRGAEESGMSTESMFHFANSVEAGRFLQDRIQSGDLLLIKGSQVSRMEKIVKELMAEPLRAKELLVRQGKEWQ